MNPKKTTAVEYESDDDSGDDSVIGRAFWRSLGLILGAIAVVGGLYILTYSGSAKVKLSKTETNAPTVRETYAIQKLPKVMFKDVTVHAGIRFIHYNGKAGERLLPESMGSGAGFFDFDNDGDQDLLFVNGTDWEWQKSADEESSKDSRNSIVLYRNDGLGNFEDVTALMGLKLNYFAMGPAFGDYDGDGWIDLFITGVGCCQLFHNDSGKGFTNTTEAMGIRGDDNDWTCPAMFFDYDRDGKLDLLVGKYVQWSREIDLRQGFTLTGLGRAYGPPTAFGGTYLTLYHNDGTIFSNVSEQSGIRIQNPATKVPVAKSLALVMIDANFDGWPDVVVANDTVQNFLLLNKRDGTFEEIGASAGIALDRMGAATGAMGIDCANLRNDENLAVAIGNFANEPSSLYLSHAGKPAFSDKASATGFGPQTKRMLTFGLFFADMDLDSRVDIVCGNGHIEDEIAKVQPNQRYAQPPQLFWNAGRSDSTSDELVPLAEEQTGEDFQQPMVGRAAAYADIDSDGDLDIVFTANGGPARLLRNDLQTENRWLRVELRGAGANVFAIGATARIQIDEDYMSRTVSPTKSYLSQCELPLTFGIPQEKNPSKIEITWPDGQTESIPINGFNKVMKIEQKKPAP